MATKHALLWMFAASVFWFLTASHVLYRVYLSPIVRDLSGYTAPYQPKNATPAYQDTRMYLYDCAIHMETFQSKTEWLFFVTVTTSYVGLMTLFSVIILSNLHRRFHDSPVITSGACSQQLAFSTSLRYLRKKTKPPRKQRFQFSLRALVLAIALLAFWLSGYYTAVKSLKEFGGSILPVGTESNAR